VSKGDLATFFSFFQHSGGIIYTASMRSTFQTKMIGSIELSFIMVIGTKIISPSFVGPEKRPFLTTSRQFYPYTENRELLFVLFTRSRNQSLKYLFIPSFNETLLKQRRIKHSVSAMRIFTDKQNGATLTAGNFCGH
jgi:hypothetical protein